MRHLLVIIGLLMAGYSAFAQQIPDWTLVPNKVHFTSSGGTVSAMPAGSYTTPYHAANCGYDENGNILFYVVDGNVYNSSGTLAGSLSNGTPVNGKDIIVIPDPSSCNAHLVIHTSTINWVSGNCSIYTDIRSTSITHSGSTLTITPNSSVIGSFQNCNMYVGMAVSQPQANGSRFLYVAGDSEIDKYVIGGGSINWVSSYALTGNTPTDIAISPTGDKIAWSNFNSNGDVRWIDLDANGNLGAYHDHYMSGSYKVYGLEFIDNTTLIIAANDYDNTNTTYDGLYSLNLNTSISTQLPISASAYATSQLERGLDNRIYAASATGLLGVNPATNATTIITTPINSNFDDIYMFNRTVYYSLPKQSGMTCCAGEKTITGTYSTALTESGTWIRTNGTTTIPSTASVKLDASPILGYVELNPGFESQPTGTGLFVAQAFNGCTAGAPQKWSQPNSTLQPNMAMLAIAPNPFHTTANISYNLDSDAPVSLTVFDATGRLVSTLVNNQTQSAGTYSHEFDGSNLAAGMYICHLQTGDKVQVQKIMLTR